MKIYKNEKIVAYTQGEVFNKEELNQIAHPFNLYVFTGYTGDWRAENNFEVEVWAKNPKLALEAIGYYDNYEKSWGDFRGVIEAINNNNCQLFQKIVKYYKRDLGKYIKSAQS